MTKLIRCLIFVSLLAAAAAARADVGVLIPGDEDAPDPAKLTLDEARIDIRLDRQYARVRIVQIFGNHTNRRLEGKYVFTIPGDSAVSDFAVWDGVVRIPGVILERKRASELYENIKMQQIDPGLLQQEEEAEGPRMASTFSARIVPILPYATKRLELEYTQRLSIENMKAYFSLPLKPDLYREQSIGKLRITLQVLSSFPMADFQLSAKQYPLRFTVSSPDRMEGSFEASNFAPAEDFAVTYRLATTRDELAFLAYRGSEQMLQSTNGPITSEDQPSETKVDDGYFWSSALFQTKPEAAAERPRSLVILLDTSSSMRWEKLDQAYAALDYFLHHLTEKDEYRLILFHQEALSQSQTPLPATKANIESSLNFVKSQYLMGGTDFQKAFQEAFAAASQLKNADRYLAVITDGNPTLTQLQAGRLLEQFKKGNKTAKFRAFLFGIGSDANRTLLSEIAEASNGLSETATENEDLAFKLEAFFGKIGRYPATNLVLQSSQPDLLYKVYPAEPSRVYLGTSHDWFGRYRSPATGITLSVSGSQEGAPLSLKQTVDFPETALEHDFIPRGWARMRVDFLLRKMELEGEDQESIDEIIALSKKYKFVTPYTSFLAAPRSLLRPRLIRPGDPLLRVKTDPDIVSITAIFPFGLVKSLTYLESEQVWQTRFLVPVSMKDGTYSCRLILRDKDGNQYNEKKSFVVDSRPPVFKTKLDRKLHRGRTVKILVAADSDTRSIFARLENLPPIRLEWSGTEKASVGYLKIPAEYSSGVFTLEVAAEDFAHNQSRWSTSVEVL